MELKITLEGYKAKTDFSPLSKSECWISIDQSEEYSPSDTFLAMVFHHLYKVLSERWKAIIMKMETDR